ncbi:MAG: hypothetical protein HC771_14800 [Synechococcales cyanobacterium CRU_2_2]|nr:hypothetical protein [Synechococcales cyanobacterium CRU_2_2]
MEAIDDAPSEAEAMASLSIEHPQATPSKAVRPKASKAKPSKLASVSPSTDEPNQPINDEILAIPDETPEQAPDEADAPPTFVADWSDDLAQIQVELKRLGWNAKQEADYLQRTYGKPSRDYITDYSELVNFLSYLRALPTHFDPNQFDNFDELETEVNIPADNERSAARPDTATTTPAIPVTEVPVTEVPVTEIPVTEIPVTEIPEELDDQGGLSREEMMQQTAAECQRLKWTNRQGSNFLKSRYGKPTRKDLTNAELWDFLQYLSAVAPVEESVTEKLPF